MQELLISGFDSNSASPTDIWQLSDGNEFFIAKVFLRNKPFYGDLYYYEALIYDAITKEYPISPLFIKAKKYYEYPISEISNLVFNYFLNSPDCRKFYNKNIDKSINFKDIVTFITQYNMYASYKYMDKITKKYEGRKSITYIDEKGILATLSDVTKFNDLLENYRRISGEKCGLIINEYSKGSSLRDLMVEMPNINSIISILLMSVWKLQYISINHNDLHFGNVLTKKYDYRQFYIIFNNKLYKLNTDYIPCLYDYDRSTSQRLPNTSLRQFEIQNRVGYVNFSRARDFVKALCILTTNYKMKETLKSVMLSFFKNERFNKYIFDNDRKSDENCKLSTEFYTSDLDSTFRTDDFFEWFLGKNEWIPLSVIDDSNYVHPWLTNIKNTILQVMGMPKYKNKKMNFRDHFNNMIDYDTPQSAEYYRNIILRKITN